MAEVKTMDVDVIVTRDPRDPKVVTFDLDAGNGKTNTLDFHNNGHPGNLVYFNFVDDKKNPTGLTFQQDPQDALWVQVGKSNPPKDAKWPGFVPLSVENNDTRLIVYNRNLKSGVQFKFTLWFRWPDGTPEPYDPIGNDNNGAR